MSDKCKITKDKTIWKYYICYIYIYIVIRKNIKIY